jgi:alpha-galactosidase/6-phospho-beta-glucosidase family protein
MYFDAINIRNNGAVDNLPDDVILDVPALAIGGQVRSIHVGKLPMGPAEICRRQTVLHEMIAQAGGEGDEDLVIQALCLDPYVGSLHKAENLWADYKKAYKAELTTFRQ